MELITAGFLAISFTFLGHLFHVIAHHFERPKRPIHRVPDAPLTSPPSPKRSILPCTLAPAVPA